MSINDFIYLYIIKAYSITLLNLMRKSFTINENAPLVKLVSDTTWEWSLFL